MAAFVYLLEMSARKENMASGVPMVSALNLKEVPFLGIVVLLIKTL
jgi:hypothetical protein